ncbi:hypothetical protein ACMATS_02270 [Streptoverticillium reticulum]
MIAEADTPLAHRILLVEGRATEKVLADVSRALPRLSVNEEALFLSYNYADVPVGRSYGCCYRRTDASDVVRVTTTVVAVTQQWAHKWDAIPHGWKTLAVLRFEPEIPEMIRDLPTASRWHEHPIAVHISDQDTWEARVKMGEAQAD